MTRFKQIAVPVLIVCVILLPLLIGVLAQGQLGRVLEIEIGKGENAKSQMERAYAKHFDDRDFQAAIDEYQQVIKRFPNSPEAVEAQFRIANVYQWNQVEPEKARVEYQKVTNSSPDTDYAVKALIRTGECYAQLKTFDKAINYFQQVVDRYSDSPYVPQALLTKANTLLFGMHELEQADVLYADITQQFPGTEHALEAKLWQTYRRLKPETSEAEKMSIYQGILKEAEDYQLQSKVQYMVAFSYYLQGQQHKAIQEAKKILTDYPDTHGNQLALVHYFIGGMYERLKQYKQTLNWYETGLSKYPKNSLADRMRRAIQRVQHKQMYQMKEAEDYQRQVTSQSAGNNYAKLFADLSSPDDRVRSQAYTQIKDALPVGRDLEEILRLAIQHLRAKSARARAYSALILASAGSRAYHADNKIVNQRVFHALVPLIEQEQDTWVRTVLATALGRLALEEVIPLLKQMSFDPEHEVAREALYSLGNIGHTRYTDQITPFLLQELRTELSRFPQSTTSKGDALLDALGRVDDRRALEGFVLASSHNAGVRQGALMSLAIFTTHHRYPSRDLPAKRHAYSVSLADRQRADALIAKMLTDPNESVRRKAQSILDHIDKMDREYEYETSVRDKYEQRKRAKE